MERSSCAELSELWYRVLHPEEQEVIEKPKGENKMYSVGEWIRVASWTYTDFVGYILEVNQETKVYTIQLTKNKHGHLVKSVVNLHEDEIYRADLEDGYDTDFFQELAVDWALVTKNEALFNKTIKGGNENDVE